MKSAPIIGYRDLSAGDVDLINTIKQAELDLGELWRRLSQDGDLDKRWLAVAKTHFQEGFSAFVRAVAQPEDAF